MRMSMERHWYSRSLTWFTLLLVPLSWIFYCLLQCRYFLYRKHIKKTAYFPVPVIVVGNITVGGTGKTPFVIWLAKFLQNQGFHPGIVSRGVGGKQSFIPREVKKDSLPSDVGDEALLLAKTNIPVVLCIDRVAAVNALLKQHSCDVIIADDGLQHYRLGRDIEIAMVDGIRRFGNECLLPAGPLRESVARIKSVDFVVVQGTPKQHEFGMSLEGDQLISIIHPDHKKPLQTFKKVHAVAAIGHPARFFALLKNAGLDIIEHEFPDHYLYQALDFDFHDDLPILMTEKDAVKCQRFADHRFWYLPVTLQMDTLFQKQLLAKLKDCLCKKSASSQ